MTISNTIIQIKKSGITGNVPNSLNNGELALNYVDDKLFYKNANGGTSWFYGANNGPSFSTLSNGVVSITATAPNDILTLVAANGISTSINTSTKTITFGFGANNISISNTTPTTSKTTGALIVAGGVGVSGNVYANNIYSNGLQVSNKPTVFIYSMIFGGS